MTVTRSLEDRYRDALVTYLSGEDSENALLSAYDCGRQVLADNRSPLDLVAIHHAALMDATLQRSLDAATVQFVASGQEILSHSLVSFEVARRGFAEANVALRELNTTLEARVAELRLSEAKLNQSLESERLARAEAEAALRERDEFLSVAAHELKTPLTSLRGYVGLAQRALGQESSRRRERIVDALKRIDHQTERLGRLVSLLMDTIMLDLGRFQIDREWTDVTALVEQVMRTSQARTNQHALQLRRQGVAMAFVDALRLRDVVANLVDNAIRYSPDGGPINIEVAVTPHATVNIAVRDFGLGVPLERRASLFQRFFRGHDDRYASGLGLGLFISREIISRHGGQLFAEFPTDGGTRLVIEIPVGQAANAREDLSTAAGDYAHRTPE